MHRLLRKDVYEMFEIKGKIATAICYAKVVEDEAIEQIRRMCDYDLTKKQQGAYYARCSCRKRMYNRDNNDSYR